MKLFVFAVLVAAASAGRLEHLERSYLPPDSHAHSRNGFDSGNGRFGVNGQSPNIFGSNGQDSVVIDSNDGASFRSNGFGANQGLGSNGLNRNVAFGGATSNQYLPPNHGPSASSNYGGHQFGSHGGSSLGSNGFGSLSSSRAFGSQPQFGAASRQYLAPKHSSSQQTQQQPFDFVFAALVVAASAGRLEHLERSYLPPDSNGHGENSFGPGNNRFAINNHSSNGLSRNSASNGFRSNGINSFDRSTSHASNRFGAAPVSGLNGMSRNAFESATFNQYLPPDHGPSHSSDNGISQFTSRSLPSLGSASFGSPSRSIPQPQFGAASRQYLAPKYTSQQNPQQRFDEKSGYIY
ncbi:unnamed protein product [Danaus chrysippus]|uniref:(African queen) hypothetical protein n=1 Tax=Danaus chrysippus TaxID=151541 RepID=A0A8J2QNL0_9NEOP|nr:unnamed protein product [Danaus chrysippus]